MGLRRTEGKVSSGAYAINVPVFGHKKCSILCHTNIIVDQLNISIKVECNESQIQIQMKMKIKEQILKY